MYAWGEGGRGDRRGTSNVPEPPETAVAATMSREEKVASIPPVIVVEEQPCTQTEADSSSDVCSVDLSGESGYERSTNEYEVVGVDVGHCSAAAEKAPVGADAIDAEAVADRQELSPLRRKPQSRKATVPEAAVATGTNDTGDQKDRTPGSGSGGQAGCQKPQSRTEAQRRQSRTEDTKSQQEPQSRKEAQRGQSCKRRKVELTHTGGSQIWIGLRDGLVERVAMGSAACSSTHEEIGGEGCSSTDKKVVRDATQPLPASVGLGNLMVATWAVGRECSIEDLARKLCTAPFDFICLVLSSAVAEDGDIMIFLRDLCKAHALAANAESGRKDCAQMVLQEKTVHCLGKASWRRVFVVLHKAKVTGAVYDEQYIRSRGPERDMCFGTLRLCLDQRRQRMDGVTVGIIDVRREVDDYDVDALVSWAVLHRLDMLTGFFGNPCMAEFVSDFATRTGAISWTPFFQPIRNVGMNRGCTQASTCCSGYTGKSRCLKTTPKSRLCCAWVMTLGVIWCA